MDKDINTITNEDLLEISKSILSNLKIIDKKESNINFDKAIEELKTLTTKHKNNELNLFIHFLKNLFLSDNMK